MPSISISKQTETQRTGGGGGGCEAFCSLSTPHPILQQDAPPQLLDGVDAYFDDVIVQLGILYLTFLACANLLIVLLLDS